MFLLTYRLDYHCVGLCNIIWSMGQKKFVLIVPDGAWDRPVSELGGKTPLQVAKTPNMDRLAREGVVGLVRTVPDGFSPGSDVANMSLLGYPPEEFYSGRAPLEAANIGVEVKPDEVGFRCNLVTVSEGRMIDYSAGHISTQEAEYLIDDLNRELGSESIVFYAGTSYRNLLLIKGVENPSDFLSIKCTPPHNIIGKEIRDYLPKGPNERAVRLLRDLMENSVRVLAKSDVNRVRIDLGENPATMIWLWGQGIGRFMPSFQSRYGLRGGIISAVDLLKGLGRKIGLEVIEVPGATGYYDTNYRGKARGAIEGLERMDFVMIHIEAPDEAGHNGEVDEKIKALERIDSMVVGPLIEYLRQKGGRLLLSPDHPTPVDLRTHTADPVGFVMWGDGIAPDKAETYDEQSCSRSGVFIPSGPDLFNVFLREVI